ncbi:Tankyrase-2 [Armadillidium vulgare]|nr:Tankyrase-2 [Armadillidium vulgare]
MGEIGVPPALSDAVESLKDAIKAGRTDIFRKLLETCETCEGGGLEERKQLVNSIATDEGTFLHMATKLGRSDIIRALLASGADPGVLDKNGNTPIQICPTSSILSIFMEDLLQATAKSEIGRVCQLIASGMNVNAHDNQLSRNTPLHWAASFGDVDTIICLIARGADVNSCNSEGATPLHDAVARGDPTVIESLLDHGANPHIQCQKGPHKGKTALEMAKLNPELSKTMEKYLSDPSRIENSHYEFSNGSVSPVLGGKSLNEQGSYESLVSVGADSVITNSIDINHPRMKLLRAQSLTSVGEESVNNQPMQNGINGNIQVASARLPLESTSSLEMTPNMEQVCERLAAVQLTMPPKPLVMNSALHRLWPQPKKITELPGQPWRVPKIVTLAVNYGSIPVHQIVDVWNVHKPWLQELNCDIQLGSIIGPRNYNKGNAIIHCVVDPALVMSENHYSITVEENGVKLISGSLSALHHALITFAQLLRVFRSDEIRVPTSSSSSSSHSGVVIPPLVITDFPSIPNRGFAMDMTPAGRIPTLERVCQIVDTLASLKINHLHLLFKISASSASSAFSEENQYSQSRPQTRHPSYIEYHCQLPFSQNELVSLERYCSDRGIILTPGFDLNTITSNDKLAIYDISSTISEALSALPSARYVHIGPNLTSLLAEVSTLNSTSPWSQLLLPDNANLMVCANIFHDNSAALDRLPLSCILVEYGFQADYDFSGGCKMAMNKGRSLALCPGTSAWSSLSGWPEAGVSNVYSGVVSSLESGSNTVLVAHWSNSACLTPLDFVHSSVGSLIDQHIIKIPNCGLGDALIELGRCETWLTRVARDQPSNDPSDLPSCQGSILHQLFTDPDSVVMDHLSSDVFGVVMRHVRKAVKEGVNKQGERNPLKGRIERVSSRSPWPMASLAVLEIHLAMDMILTACRLGRALVTTGTNPRSNMGVAVMNPGVANLPPTMRTDLANKVLALREAYSSVWLQGHRPKGLHSSLLIFSSLLARLLPEQMMHGV